MPSDSIWPTMRTALIWLGLAAAFLILWRIREALLIVFGAILLAILLRTLARGICRLTHMPDGWGLACATLLVIAIIGGTIALFGAQMTAQLHDVVANVSAGERDLMAYLDRHAGHGVGKTVSHEGTSYLGDVVSNAARLSVGFVEGVIVLAVTAVYLAAQPDLYRRGFLKLFASAHKDNAAEAYDLIGVSLRLWMLGQAILMVMVGVLSALAVWLIGLPGAAALGLIAGLSEMVPYVGPFVGAVPALFVAFTVNWQAALWTMLAYLGIHLLEGYFAAPMLQRFFIRIPPALVLAGIAAVQLLFGAIGVIFAAPMVVAIFTAVKVLYVRDTLGERASVPDHAPI